MEPHARSQVSSGQGGLIMSRTRHIKGHEHVELVRAIADSGLTYQEIALRFDRGEQTIYNFASANRVEIEECRANSGSMIKNRWIADKELRIAELQQKYEDIQTIIDDMEEDNEKEGDDHIALNVQLYDKLVGRQQSIMKQAAEEMGHLPTRMPNEGPPPEAVQWVIRREEKT